MLAMLALLALLKGRSRIVCWFSEEDERLCILGETFYVWLDEAGCLHGEVIVIVLEKLSQDRNQMENVKALKGKTEGCPEYLRR